PQLPQACDFYLQPQQQPQQSQRPQRQRPKSRSSAQGLKLNQASMAPIAQQPQNGYNQASSHSHSHPIANLPPSLAVARSNPSTPDGHGNAASDYFSAGIPGLPPLDAYDIRAKNDQQGLTNTNDRLQHAQNYDTAAHVRPYNARAQQTTQPQEPMQQHQNSEAVPDASVQEASGLWPLERVVQWLAQNGFSSYWQQAFKELRIEGLGFIELAGGVNGRLNYSKMHQVVYPQIRKLAEQSGHAFDLSHEREEGRRMRKLIKSMVDSGSLDDALAQSPSSQHHHQLRVRIPSGSTDAGTEPSPSVKRTTPLEPFFMDTRFAPEASSAYEQVDNEHTSGSRPVSGEKTASGLQRNMFGIPDERRRHSRTPSYGSVTATSALRSISDGTHLASPASKPTPSPYYDNSEAHPDQRFSAHSKQNSWVSSSSQGHTTQHQARTAPRNDLQRASPLDYPKHLGEKEHGKGFLGMFSRKKKSDLQPYHEDDSPTSPHPFTLRQNAVPASVPRPGVNVSDYTHNDWPTTGASEVEKSQAQARKTSPPARKYAFVTQDGWNYRLVDITDLETPDALRATLCHSIGIKDHTTASVFLTEPGQSAHLDPLNDTALVSHRRNRSDSQGTLKLFIHDYGALHKYSTPLTPSANAPSPEKRSAYPSVSDEDSRKSGSLVGSSEHDTLTTQATDSPKSEFDLMAAHEQYKQEVERKQKAYLQHRQEQSSKAAKSTSFGIKRDGVIDFDAPRASPYRDEKKAEKEASELNSPALVPLRKPPSAPSESTTLTKVNSLRKASRIEPPKRKPFDNVDTVNVQKDSPGKDSRPVTLSSYRTVDHNPGKYLCLS
ncbi:hypothetical protein KEM55_002173, partial [Ascosphaera atra]